MFDDAAQLRHKDRRQTYQKDRAAAAAAYGKRWHIFESDGHGVEKSGIAMCDKLCRMKRLDQQPLGYSDEIMFVPRDLRAPADRVARQNDAIPLVNRRRRPASGADDKVPGRLDGRQIVLRDWDRRDVNSLLIYISFAGATRYGGLWWETRPASG